MQLRISAGDFKNIKLVSSQEARPLRERVKLSIFSILSQKLESSSVLDLYAGSGNLGFEALSRGATSCTFIDSNYHSIKAIRDNFNSIKKAHLEEISQKETRIIKDDAVKYVTNTTEHYDAILMDPPYDLPINHVFKYIHEALNENGILIYMHRTKSKINVEELNTNLKIVDTRTYGITKVDFITKT